MNMPNVMTTYPAVVGAFLSIRRKELGLSQTQLATAVGLTVSTWSRIENGESALTIEQLAQAAQALGLTPGSLLQTIDTAITELHEKGIGTNVERASVQEISAAGSIPLIGAGLSSAVAAGGVIAAGASVAAAPIALGIAAYGLYKWLRD